MKEKEKSGSPSTSPRDPLGSGNRAGLIARVGILAAIGVVLGYVSLQIPLFGSQVALDFSHLATMVAAVFLGPFAGGATGLIIGIPPSIRFGNFLIFPLKAVTGFLVAWLMRWLKIPFLAVIIGYIPESLLTYLTLSVWGIPYPLPWPVVSVILVKAWIEIGIIAVVVELLWRSPLKKYVYYPPVTTNPFDRKATTLKSKETAEGFSRFAQLLQEGLFTEEEWSRFKRSTLDRPTANSEESAQAIWTLYQLFKQGALSESEFNTKKWEILGRL